MNETTVTIVGTVCSEVRYGQATDETPMARFQIRNTPRRYDKRTGTWTDGDPSYYSAICFRGLADHVASSMGVGDPVVATGRLRINRWRRGEDHMVTAELDIHAIGHDLRWGTTVYRRAAPTMPGRIPGPAPARGSTRTDSGSTTETGDLPERNNSELVPSGAGADAAAAAAAAAAADGAHGSTGALGSTGSTGALGSTGNTGALGSTGSPDSPGALGGPGSSASPGACGSPGSLGALGRPGMLGACGSPGSPGDRAATDAGEWTGSELAPATATATATNETPAHDRPPNKAPETSTDTEVMHLPVAA